MDNYFEAVLRAKNVKEMDLVEDIINIIDGEDEETLMDMKKLLINYIGISAGEISNKLSFSEIMNLEWNKNSL